jgi:hypothetical protein
MFNLLEGMTCSLKQAHRDLIKEPHEWMTTLTTCQWEACFKNETEKTLNKMGPCAALSHEELGLGFTSVTLDGRQAKPIVRGDYKLCEHHSAELDLLKTNRAIAAIEAQPGLTAATANQMTAGLVAESLAEADTLDEIKEAAYKMAGCYFPLLKKQLDAELLIASTPVTSSLPLDPTEEDDSDEDSSSSSSSSNNKSNNGRSTKRPSSSPKPKPKRTSPLSPPEVELPALSPLSVSQEAEAAAVPSSPSPLSKDY